MVNPNTVKYTYEPDTKPRTKVNELSVNAKQFFVKSRRQGLTY